MYVCLCKGLTEADIQRAVGQDGRISAKAIAALGLDDEAACGRCLHDIDDLLTPTTGKRRQPATLTRRPPRATYASPRPIRLRLRVVSRR